MTTSAPMQRGITHITFMQEWPSPILSRPCRDGSPSRPYNRGPVDRERGSSTRADINKRPCPWTTAPAQAKAADCYFGNGISVCHSLNPARCLERNYKFGQEPTSRFRDRLYALPQAQVPFRSLPRYSVRPADKNSPDASCKRMEALLCLRIVVINWSGCIFLAACGKRQFS